MTAVKDIISDLWKAGFKKEARAFYRLAKGTSQEERNLQFKIFNDILDDMGVQDPRLEVDAKKGMASFYVHGMSIVAFPRFLERFMRNLYENGTRKYKLDHIDRQDPMRVYVKL